MANIAANLDDKVRESLREKILAGSLQGGAHLSELKISKEFSVSRTPVREALCALAADGLVEMVPHRGAFVRERSGDIMQDYVTVYGELMGVAARMATENAGIETIMELESAISGMKGMDSTAISQITQAVHNLIIQASGSSTIAEMLGMLEKRVPTGSLTSVGKEAVQEYAVLMGAFKRRKGEAAEKSMRQIMSMVSKG